MKRFTRYTQYTRYTRYTGKKEDVYPLVLAFVGAILGWAAVKTRDLEGTLALVKWGLVLGFIAVAVTLVPLLLARLLWDRKSRSGTTAYFIQTKPARRLTEIPDLSPVYAPFAEFRLLFPEGTGETPPPEEFVTAYDASLGKILKTDGIPYYTDDPAVIAYRAELFRELRGKPALLGILCRFAEDYPADSSGESLWKSLSDCKARHDEVKALRNALNKAGPQSAALRALRNHLNEAAGSKAGQAEEETFAALPEDLFSVKSVTLAVNLDSGGHAHEAGIVALHGEPFDDSAAVPLVHPDRERYHLTVAFNRELMSCVDRVLAEELRRLEVDLDALRRTAVSGTLAREIRFAAEIAEKVHGGPSDPQIMRTIRCWGDTVTETGGIPGRRKM